MIDPKTTTSLNERPGDFDTSPEQGGTAGRDVTPYSKDTEGTGIKGLTKDASEAPIRAGLPVDAVTCVTGSKHPSAEVACAPNTRARLAGCAQHTMVIVADSSDTDAVTGALAMDAVSVNTNADHA